MKLQTTNPDFGFHGTIDGDVAHAWRSALDAVHCATDAAKEQVVFFLDSTFGRHLANEINGKIRFVGFEAALATVVSEWASLTVSRGTARDLGIAPKKPYLASLVGFCAAED